MGVSTLFRGVVPGRVSVVAGTKGSTLTMEVNSLSGNIYMLETLSSRPLKTGSRKIRADRRARGYIWCLVFVLLYSWYGGVWY